MTTSQAYGRMIIEIESEEQKMNDDRTLVRVENRCNDNEDYFLLTPDQIDFLKFLEDYGYLHEDTNVLYEVAMPKPTVFGTRTKGVR